MVDSSLATISCVRLCIAHVQHTPYTGLDLHLGPAQISHLIVSALFRGAYAKAMSAMRTAMPMQAPDIMPFAVASLETPGTGLIKDRI